MSDIEGIESAKINFLTEKLTVETTLDEVATEALLVKAAMNFESGIKIEK